ncbi:type II toxin-antitoxin system VapB family antitoxin [Micromonospora chalcea]|uniref:type II toxin-antitoxin system VapB family antitoxin n=1 Tax=Micromonospora chalcea TaxID=1874 RepID=UPI003820133F
MSRTTLDVDDRLVAEDDEILATGARSATVNAALQASVNREKRREFADWLKSGGLPDLTEPEQLTKP